MMHCPIIDWPARRLALKFGIRGFLVGSCIAFGLCLPSFSLANTTTFGLLDCIGSALKNQSDIESAKLDVDFSEQTYQEASGQFDTSFQVSMEHGETRSPLTAAYTADQQLNTETAYRLGAGRQLRSGLQVGSELQTTRTQIDRSLSSYESPLIAASRSGVYLVATVPLLRGLGTEVVAGMETAARQDATTARIELQHSISQVVYETSLAYWQYVLDHLYVQQYHEAEQRAEEMYEQTRSLVEADELPIAQLDESKANLSDKRTAGIRAEKARIESRLNLGMAMGIPFEQLHNLPSPQDDFTLVDIRPEIFAQLDRASLIEHAVLTRRDLHASRRREESISTREKVIEDQLRPKMDLGLRIGYEGLKEGDSYMNMLESSASHVRGTSWQLSLTYEFSIENRTALGRLGQQQIEKRRQQLYTRELTRSVQSSVYTTLEVLQQTILELENAQKTVNLYEKAVANKSMEFRLGTGTQLDLINTQDNLTQARLRSIEAQYKGARALSRLRYQTASLVTFVQDEAQVDLYNLTTMPGIRSTENGRGK